MNVLLLLLLILTLFAAPTTAHTNFISPQAYNDFECQLPFCTKACPPIWKTGRFAARNSPQNPAKVWRRGQKVRIDWRRNNHEGGFVRFSLVPTKYMFDRAWHRHTAFHWSCYVSNQFWCGASPNCGADKGRLGFRTNATIPTIFPDGDYVLAMVWYGGIHWKTKKAYFPDYYSCSFVKIQGGPLAYSYKPNFRAGWNRHAYIRRKGQVCQSTSQWAGHCKGLPCHGKPLLFTKPGEFMAGRRPKPLLRSMFNNIGDGLDMRDKELVLGTLQEELQAIRAEKWDSAIDRQQAIDEAKQEARERAAELRQQQSVETEHGE